LVASHASSAASFTSSIGTQRSAVTLMLQAQTQQQSNM
jgi:hypothetical protein